MRRPPMPVPPQSRMEPDEVAGILTAFVNTHIMAPGRPMRPDDAFETVGVDSMALLRILVFIETTFGFWMPDQDLVEENLTSPRALANYICRRGSAS